MQSLIVLASLVFEFAGRVKISGLPSPEIRASLEEFIVLESSLKGLSTTRILFILKNLKI